MTSLYIIAGGPHTGKSTVIKSLEKRGYEIVPEAARRIIKQQKKKDDPILPTTHLYGFQCLVLQEQLALERRVKGGMAFLDRCLIDNIPYCNVAGIKAPNLMMDEIDSRLKDGSYLQAFLLDPIPGYKKDDERFEDPALAKRIHDEIVSVYQGYGTRGLHITPVPIFDLGSTRANKKARVEYVLDMMVRQRLS
jgi:predicted ATPase